MKQRLVIAVVFVVGCIAGGVSSRIVVPPARAGTHPALWDHHCFRGDMDDESKSLIDHGKEGWELVSVTSMSRPIGDPDLLFCYKRPH
jgi:hypothetical protein